METSSEITTTGRPTLSFEEKVTDTYGPHFKNLEFFMNQAEDRIVVVQKKIDQLSCFLKTLKENMNQINQSSSFSKFSDKNF